MNIFNKLHKKIQDLRESGMDNTQIRSEGLKFLKDTLKESSFKERKEFFLHIERDKKLKEILS